jgi:uncharacterized protein with HEPN domain
MPPEDLIRFTHMLEAARNALEFADGRRREDLDEDMMLTLALTRLVEIIGEAASRITQQTRDQHASFPWRDMITMRNRLIHAYHDISLDILWQTVVEDLPLLTGLIEQILSTEQE